MKIYINENTFKKLILNEYMSTWEHEKEINELINIIKNDVNKLTPQEKLKFYKEYSLLFNKAQIKIIVIGKNLQKTNKKFGGMRFGCDGHIELYIDGNTKVDDNFKILLHHELEHHIFRQRETQDNAKKHSYYFNNDNYFNLGGNWGTNKTYQTIDEILYRLWSNNERNSFQTLCMKSLTSVKNDYDYLLEKIKSLEKNQSDVVTKGVWLYVGYFLINKLQYSKKEFDNFSKNIYPKIYGNDKLIQKYKKFFIKKSYYLLEKWYKKTLKNWYQYNSERKPEEISKVSDNNNKIQNVLDTQNEIKNLIRQNLDVFSINLWEGCCLNKCYDFIQRGFVTLPPILKKPYTAELKFYSVWKEKKVREGQWTHIIQVPSFVYKNKGCYFEGNVLNICPNSAMCDYFLELKKKCNEIYINSSKVIIKDENETNVEYFDRRREYYEKEMYEFLTSESVTKIMANEIKKVVKKFLSNN